MPRSVGKKQVTFRGLWQTRRDPNTAGSLKGTGFSNERS
jgi:hypothetical protein